MYPIERRIEILKEIDVELSKVQECLMQNDFPLLRKKHDIMNNLLDAHHEIKEYLKRLEDFVNEE